MHNGTVFLPAPISRDYHPSDWSSLFAETLAETFNWKLISGHKLNIDAVEGDILFTIKAPQCGFIDVLGDIGRVPKHIKVINYLQDIRGDAYYFKRMEQILKRSDLILYSYKQSFENGWPQYTKKGLYFPIFVSPSDRFFSLGSHVQLKKCLVIGATDPTWYPLRHKATTLSKDLVTVVPHPGYQTSVKTLQKDNRFVGANRYAELMNQHICCVTSTLHNIKEKCTYHWVVLKLFEIMAAGSVLVSNWCEEMAELGFKDGVNFVSANVDNLEEKVGDIVSHPLKYEQISKNGRALAKSHHTVANRIESLKEILEGIGYRSS